MGALILRPGRRRAGTDESGNPIWECLHPERLTWGGIASHRDYNKPECPGRAITESYYIDVLQQGWQRLVGGGTVAGAPIADATPLLAGGPHQ